jgi:hypothetical protein
MMLEQIEAARLLGLQLVAEGRERGFPLAMSHLAVQIMLQKRGLPVPDDIFAFLFEGKVSDRQVTNWNAPEGV